MRFCIAYPRTAKRLGNNRSSYHALITTRLLIRNKSYVNVTHLRALAPTADLCSPLKSSQLTHPYTSGRKNDFQDKRKYELSPLELACVWHIGNSFYVTFVCVLSDSKYCWKEQWDRHVFSSAQLDVNSASKYDATGRCRQTLVDHFKG